MNKEIQFSMIVARGVNGEIGQDGDLLGMSKEFG